MVRKEASGSMGHYNNSIESTMMVFIRMKKAMVEAKGIISDQHNT